MFPLLERLGLTIPLFQAPMAGVSTPELAAAVSNAGGLGAIGVGATDAKGAQAMIAEVRARTDHAFQVNLFVHAEPSADAMREAAWIEALRPVFAAYDAQPPQQLSTIYTSFAYDADMLAMLVAMRLPAISFHFGLPSPEVIAQLRGSGAVLFATATNPAEAQQIAAAGIDVVVAQGVEAGGHRGVFAPDAPDPALGVMALTRLLVRQGALPVVAAGGMMDGAGIAAALDLGAVAAQLGTAFIVCPESAADDAYRAALTGPGAENTQFTRLISGRPARVLANRFTDLAPALAGLVPPAYPRAYDAGKALHAAAKARGEFGFGAQWAGQGAPLARAMPAAQLVATLRDELAAAR